MGTPADEIILDEVIPGALFDAADASAATAADVAAQQPVVPETPAPTAPETPPPTTPVDPNTGLPQPEIKPYTPDTSASNAMTDQLARSLSVGPQFTSPYEPVADIGDAPTLKLENDIAEQIIKESPVTYAGEGAASELENFLNKYGKYGALGGLSLMGGLQARGLSKQAGKLRSELGDLPGAKQALATGQEMVAGAKTGQLLPGQDAAIQQFRNDKMAQLESYLQRAGIRDSSSAAALRNQVENQVQNYRQTLLQANLNQGMQLMGVSDAATAAAIKAGYGANVDAANLAQRYAAAAAYPLSGVYGPLTSGR